jgi:hypothetical protein
MLLTEARSIVVCKPYNLSFIRIIVKCARNLAIRTPKANSPFVVTKVQESDIPESVVDIFLKRVSDIAKRVPGPIYDKVKHIVDVVDKLIT